MWEKISDYCLDVSKYFLTAVFVASLMVDLGEMRWLLYAISGVLATIFFCAGLFFISKSKDEKERKYKTTRKYNNKNRRTSNGCIIFLRRCNSSLWNCFCSSFVSKGAEVG